MKDLLSYLVKKKNYGVCDGHIPVKAVLNGHGSNGQTGMVLKIATKMCDEYPRLVDYDNGILVSIFCSETQARSETNSLATLP
jgi:hypothetical protein